MLPAGELTERVIGLAIEVHRRTGPGLLESVYEQCLVQRFHGTTPIGRHVIASTAKRSPASEVRTLREIASLRSQ